MFTTEQKDMYITFKSIAKKTAKNLAEMCDLWEQMETDKQILPLCGDSYPFERSFDDVAFEFAYWVTDFQDKPIDYGWKSETYPIETYNSGGGIIICDMGTDDNTYYSVCSDYDCLSLFKNSDEPYMPEDMLWSVGVEEMTTEQKAIYSLMKAEIDRYMNR